jgi:transposase
MAFDPIAALCQWKQKVASRQERWRGAGQENEQLRKENERWRRREKQLQQREKELEQEREQREQEREQLRQENEKLKRQLEAALRANKRQAAAFSRGRRKQNPKTPGRKPGSAYGQRQGKAIPPKVDEVIVVPPPAHCECGGSLEVERIESQYQQEIIRRTFWRRFDIPLGRCQKCHRGVQGRDPRQTSDALGAAAVQIGPDALALAVRMNKGLGMPHADVAAVLQDGYQFEVNRSTICRAVDRVARRGEATWHALREAARRSRVNGIDETGWNVAAQLRWLWVAVSEQVTFCDILPGRGFPQAASLLGADYDGWLTHDGWRVYYKFLQAGHQSCLGHLLRRCQDMIQIASPAAARFPLGVQAVLQQALALGDRYQRHEISRHGLWTATGRLEVKLDGVLAHPGRDAANRRLAKHLLHERPYLLTFLYCPGLSATNNISERAIRALIGAPKNWGGNRTERGARAQAVLTSILQPAQQQDKKPFEVLVELLCASDPRKILTLVPPGRDIARDGSPPDPPPRAATVDGPASAPRQEIALPLPAVVASARLVSASGALAPVPP